MPVKRFSQLLQNQILKETDCHKANLKKNIVNLQPAEYCTTQILKQKQPRSSFQSCIILFFIVKIC